MYAKTKNWEWGAYKTLPESGGQSFLCTPVSVPLLVIHSTLKMSVQNGEAVHESAISARPLVIAVPNIRVRVQIDNRIVSVLAHVLPYISGFDPSLYQQ